MDWFSALAKSERVRETDTTCKAKVLEKPLLSSGLRFPFTLLCFSFKICPAMALVSRRRQQRMCPAMLRNAAHSARWGAVPLPGVFAKSLSIPRGSWHKGYSQDGAELLSASGSSSPIQGGKDDAVLSRRMGPECQRARGLSELQSPPGSRRVIVDTALDSSPSTTVFTQPLDQHTLSSGN